MDREIIDENESRREETLQLWCQSVQGMAEGKRVHVGSEALYDPARSQVKIRFWGPKKNGTEYYEIPPEMTGKAEILIYLDGIHASVPRDRLRWALKEKGVSEEYYDLIYEAKCLGLSIREAALTPAMLKKLIRLSADWEAEASCWGYRKNKAADIKGNRIFVLEKNNRIRGYLFGHVEQAQNSSSVMPDGTPFFEVEELYVKLAYRSRGYGSMLFQFAEEAVRDQADYIMLSTATKNWQAILHFYIQELDMSFWSARLFKRLK